LHLDDSDAGDCTFIAHISPISSVEVISTECGHVYHSECLDRWFDSQKGAPGVKCPTCRVIISKASCRRLFLSSISSEFVSKYTDLKSEVEVARNRIGQLETSLKFTQDQLEDVQDELQTARLDVERQAKEIQQLNSQVDEFMVQTAIENNWIDLVEELKTENSNLRVLLDKPLETASNNNAPEQPTPLRNLVAPTKFISDENGNLICNLPPTGKSTRSLKAEEKKVRGPVGTSNFNSIINCQELFKTTLDFKNAIATSGVDKVVAELKALVELESQQTRLVVMNAFFTFTNVH
ncbi:unnamed protein product, partial [Allacma fusca]